MTRWTEAQIEAALALEPDSGQSVGALAQELPAVKSGCICPNQHQPDETTGIIITSPSCSLHGCRSRFVPMSRLTQQSARTVGVIHSRRAT